MFPFHNISFSKLCNTKKMPMKTIKLTKIIRNEYKKLPRFELTYGIGESQFGRCFLACHNNKLCYLQFFDKTPPNTCGLLQLFPAAILKEDNQRMAKFSTKIFGDSSSNDTLEVLIKGTQFEMDVWDTLLKIQEGSTCSYEDVAIKMGKPKAIRAAANAIAKNYVAYFIPCHRVIAKNGSLHKYGGGPHRKALMLRTEGAF